MVDLVNAGGWLLDASLFDEPVDSTNFDDFFSSEKTNSKGGQAVLNSPSAGWYDEKVDLSVLDSPNGLPDHRNETDMWMEDNSAYLLGLLGDSFDPSEFAPDIFKNEGINLIEELDFPNLIPEPTSTEILDTHLASPTCNTLQLNSTEFFPAQQSPASLYSDISDAEESSCSFAVQSPESSITSDYTVNSLDSIQILASNNVASSSEFELEVSQPVKRKSENDGEKKRKIFKVMFPEDVSQSSTRKTKSGPRARDRQERKKVQNKEAAARYRVKKRMEEKVLSDEVEDLENVQTKLQEKRDELQTEIKYLKSLMCEILIKKGIMK